MPIYTYIDDRDGKIYEVFQKMNEVHEYFSKDGLKLRRVFEIPQARVDTVGNMDEFSSKEFMEKTKNKKMTLGSMWDLSAELSSKRAAKSGGIDPIKDKTIKDYRKKTKGKKHPQE